jgi:signal transduction histidine kinase
VTASHFFDILGTALLWGLGGAAVAWLLTWPARRRSRAGMLISVTLVATAASVAALFGNTEAMFISTDDEYVTVIVAVVAGLLASGVAALSAVRFAREEKSFHAALIALREGQLPADDGRRMTGELQALRKDLEFTAQTLSQSRERERTLEASRRQLVAWVSHDLRTPLAGLRAMSEALEDGVATSPSLYHKQIRIEVDRLASMVEDLFEISRLQAGTTSTQSDLVNLDDLLSDCVAAVEPVATLRGITLIGRSSTAAEVVGNGSELNRALTNLLVNAIRHTVADGTVEITLRSSDQSSGQSTGQLAEITVRDECGGIAEADIEKVFDVGFRGEPARTPQPGLGGGAGLGLAITRGIVSAHAGSVEVCNAGGGCEFTVRIPLAS